MTQQPPAAVWANLVLRLIGARDLDAVIGDLTEEYRIRRRSDSIAIAGYWYWRQVVRSLPILAVMTLRRGGWAMVAVAMVAYVLAQLVETGVEAAVFAFASVDAGVRTGVSLVIGLLTATLAGYVAESSRSGAATVLTAMSLITIVTLMVTLPDSVPMWYQLGFLTLGPVSTLGGGALSSRRS